MFLRFFGLFFFTEMCCFFKRFMGYNLFFYVEKVNIVGLVIMDIWRVVVINGRIIRFGIIKIIFKILVLLFISRLCNIFRVYSF